jgi:hypothetical protein
VVNLVTKLLPYYLTLQRHPRDTFCMHIQNKEKDGPACWQRICYSAGSIKAPPL